MDSSSGALDRISIGGEYGVNGKWVAFGILVVAAAVGVTSVVYHFFRGDQTLEYLGPDDGSRLIRGTVVELWRLRHDPETSSTEGSPAEETSGEENQLVVAGQSYTIVERKDVSTAAGMVHARHALLEDASYEWPVVPVDPSTTWELGLMFRPGETDSPTAPEPRTILAIAPQQGLVLLVGKQQACLRLTESKRAAFEGYLRALE